jgi:hypothetical protein
MNVFFNNQFNSFLNFVTNFYSRVYDNLAVFHTFELIGLWLEALVKAKKSCPPNFDYSFFFKGRFYNNFKLNIDKIFSIRNKISPRARTCPLYLSMSYHDL